jgi:hypothetical protein
MDVVIVIAVGARSQHSGKAMTSRIPQRLTKRLRNGFISELYATVASYLRCWFGFSGLQSRRLTSFVKQRLSRTNDKCLLWVISGHFAVQWRCPLYPRKQTFGSAIGIVTADVGRFRLQKRPYVE